MKKSLLYRPEIDGLRAIAVVAVIIFHAKLSFQGFNILPGGFFGVDIFFVISGFLITSIIINELELKGSFSFLNFYERRSRRILPVLMIVSLTSFIVGYAIIQSQHLILFSQSSISSILFISNIYFYISGIAYDAETSLLIPLLHTWSLSVEEQFYVIFPILLTLLFYFKKNIIKYLFILFACSLISSELLSRHNQELNFYILSSRIWELLAGSLCSIIKTKKNKQLLFTKSIHHRFHLLGFLLILFSIFFFDDSFRNPSLVTLIPIMGAIIIIFFENKDTLISKILSSRIFVFCGLISYSLYLWHYPIFSFFRTIFNNSDDNILLIKISLPPLILLLSILTYYFIEKPFRNKEIITTNCFLKTLSILLLSILFLNFLSIITKGFDHRNPQILNDNKNSIHDRGKLKDANGICDERTKDYCEFGEKNKKKIILLGDSQMASIELKLQQKSLKNNYSFSSITKKSCIYLPDFYRIHELNKYLDNSCSTKTQNYKNNFINKHGNSIIVIGGRYTMYLSGEKFDNREGGKEDAKSYQWRFKHNKDLLTLEDGIKKSILDLAKNNKVILIYPIPEVGWHVPDKLFLKYRSNLFNKKSETEIFKTYPLTTSYDVYEERNNLTFKLFDSIQDKNIYRVFPDKLFCDSLIKKRCFTHNEKDIFYYDHNHLSSKGSDMLTDYIMKTIKE
tara:strand:- start:288 stop:2330 length:2043 start_codon:yes stop_codon:yes gene_type:complete